jgi:hypothetical protein
LYVDGSLSGDRLIVTDVNVGDEYFFNGFYPLDS